MASLVAQWSQSPASANALCLSCLPRLWGWLRPLLSISSKADVCTGWLALQGQSTTSGTPSVGATAWKPLTLAVPGTCTQTKHLFSPPDLCQSPSQAPCKPHITPTNPEFQLVLSNASSPSAPSGAACHCPSRTSSLLTPPTAMSWPAQIYHPSAGAHRSPCPLSPSAALFCQITGFGHCSLGG